MHPHIHYIFLISCSCYWKWLMLHCEMQLNWSSTLFILQKAGCVVTRRHSGHDLRVTCSRRSNLVCRVGWFSDCPSMWLEESSWCQYYLYQVNSEVIYFGHAACFSLLLNTSRGTEIWKLGNEFHLDDLGFGCIQFNCIIICNDYLDVYNLPNVRRLPNLGISIEFIACNPSLFLWLGIFLAIFTVPQKFTFFFQTFLYW